MVDALLEYGATLDPEFRGQRSQFTPIAEADRLVREDPFAFLVAVICDQGVPAERAWETPYLLKQRLGHLEAARIAADGDAVTAAFQRRPKLHRFVNNVPVWIVAAAARVMRTWDGDAGRIWNDRPNADVLQQRLVAFKGIAQKEGRRGRRDPRTRPRRTDRRLGQKRCHCRHPLAPCVPKDAPG